MFWGALLGLGYIARELPNSALKRQLDIGPGAPAPGSWRPFFWLLDQIDSLLGVVLVVRLLGPLPMALVGWLLLLTLVVHPLAAAVMVALRLKDRIG